MRLVHWILVGAFWGAVAGLVVRLRPQVYQASGSLYFPSTSSEQFQRVAAALKAVPGNIPDWLLQPTSPTSVKMAKLIFESESVAQIVRQGHARNLVVSALGDAGLKFELEATQLDAAESTLRQVWRYYQSFVSTHQLSQSGRARQILDADFRRISQELADQEERLSLSRDHALRALGESMGKLNPSVLAKIRLKRVEEENVSRSVLEVLRKLRESRLSDSPLHGEQWLSDWAVTQKRLPGRIPSLGAAVRSQNLPDRIRLERVYYDTLLEYRAVLLQRAFLRTVEALESFQLEVLDPVQVYPKSRDYRPAWVIALLGVVVAWAVDRLKPK